MKVFFNRALQNAFHEGLKGMMQGQREAGAVRDRFNLSRAENRSEVRVAGILPRQRKALGDEGPYQMPEEPSVSSSRVAI